MKYSYSIAILGGYFRGDFAATFRTFFAVRFQGGISAAISPRVYAPFPQCDLRGLFRRDFSQLFRRAVLGVISVVISPRVFVLFSQCGFRGYFRADSAATFRNFSAVRIQGVFSEEISPRVFALFSRSGFRGGISAAISPRVNTPFPQCDLRGLFRGDFAATFRNFSAVRFQGLFPW